MSSRRYRGGSRLKRAKEKILIKKLTGACIMCLFVVLFVQMASAGGKKEESAQITLAVQDASILQDEALPQYTAKAECREEQQEVVLDAATGYRVSDFLDSLNGGQGYTLESDADGSKEGKYQIRLKLNDDIQEKLSGEWKGKVYLTARDGYIKVANKVGKWKGSKFKRYDGSYVQEDFVVSKEKTYYFDKKGEKVTGWQEIDGKRYYFGDDGAMESDTWKKLKKGKTYLTSDGSAAFGWLDLGDATYYFDGDGIMQTGKQQIGSSKCKFDDDGQLISRVSSIDPDKPMMALTFDDGPGERTAELLDELEKYDAHVTFFMCGKNVKKYADDVKRMVDLGCEIGNHSYDHPQLTKEADHGADQVGETNALLKDACGQPATVLRPPYGAVDDQVKATVGMPMILWNIDTLDWKTKNTENTMNVVLTTADDGDIVLMHDIHDSTIDAAIKLIPKLISNGYQLVTVSEMAEARGITLQNGQVYTDFNQ